MLDPNQLRPGNVILQKTGVRILPVRVGAAQLEALFTGAKDVFPVTLKPDILTNAGFVENKKYPLLPQAREFVLDVPVPGGAEVQIKAYVKSSGECFARAMITQISVSAPVHQLHQLQNLYYALAGAELPMKY